MSVPANNSGTSLNRYGTADCSLSSRPALSVAFNNTERLGRARELAAEGGDLATAATINLQLGGSGWLGLDAGACLAAALSCQPTARRYHLDLLLAEALLLEAAAHAFAGRRAAMELAIA